MTAPHSVLVIEDETSIASFVAAYLRNAGYTVTTAASAQAALVQLAGEIPALVILDLNLPDGDGVELCRRIRKTSDVPILMLTARDEDIDKIIGLEVGADDYMTKPFNPRELVARVKSILRRAAPERRRTESEELQHGDLNINSGKREVYVGDEEIRLAPKEFDLLWELLDHRGIVLTRDQLLERVWGYTFAGDTRTVDVHVRQIRRKLGDASPIVTVWGVGYKVASDRTAASTLRGSTLNPMLGSLRFRLTAVILAVVLVFGLVSIGLAVRLFQDVTRQQSVDELRREASGLAALYAESAIRSSDEGAKAPEFAAEKLELATGDELYYIGASLFPGQRFGLTRLPRNALGDIELARDEQVVVEFTPPGESRRLLAVSQPVQLVQGTEPFGWLIVAKPEAELREQWVSLLGRLALALAVGVALAGLLFLWLSRRLTEPVRALTRATEQVAAGRYDVEIPEPRGRDEIALLSERFRGMVAQLAEAEQLKRSFLMSVSHELRTPLTAIRGHVEAIREGIVSEPDQVRVSLDIVAAETDRLERLVGDVLDLAKLQAHRFTVRHEEVALEHLLDQAYGAFTEEARRREIDFSLSGAEAAPVIVSDGDRVLQVITNLLANAFRWTPDGGRIELRLGTVGGAVSVDVVDSGPGVPASQRKRIFEAFVSQDAEGTGLGLPIARELAVALGGGLELGPNADAGSRFRLVLPVSPALS
jgi:DNA-binding response OmpR family regulator/signal transduction histidine kinase